MEINEKENMQGIRKDEGNYHPPHRCLPRLTSSIGPKHSIVRSGKRKVTKTNDDDDKQVLPELTSDLLELIAKRLDVVGFCAFGVVCKSWWKIYATSKEDFLESLAPMAMLVSSHAKRACYLYDMANGNTKKVMLSNLVGKSFVGYSAGYMIIEDMNHQISLINPLTGHELNFRFPSFTLEGKSLHDLVILIPTLSLKSYFIIAISYSMHEIQIYHSRSQCWVSGLYFGKPWVDIKFFKNQVYVVTKKARLGKLSVMTLHSEVNWLKVKNTPNVNSPNLKLVASDDQLLMVDFVPKGHLNILKMDFDSMEWIKLDKLGDQAIFFGGKWGSSIRKPGKWGGQSNCVYYLETLSTMCCIYSMEAELIGKFSLVENQSTSKLCSNGWYYPHQCMKVEYLMDDWEI